jgi:hypothetical protein
MTRPKDWPPAQAAAPPKDADQTGAVRRQRGADILPLSLPPRGLSRRPTIDRIEEQRKGVYVPAPLVNDSAAESAARRDVRQRRTRARCIFKQTDVTRAIKAVAAAGLPVVGIKINLAGDIEVVTSSQPVQDSNLLDKWMANRARSTEGH